MANDFPFEEVPNDWPTWGTYISIQIFMEGGLHSGGQRKFQSTSPTPHFEVIPQNLM